MLEAPSGTWSPPKRAECDGVKSTSKAASGSLPSCGPGPPKSGLNSQSSDGHLGKRPSTYAVSCLKGTCTCGIRMSSRNVITSSYSSTGGISQ
ncbi:Nuclear envelope pore membrane protein POM 121C, partial [Manis javanica]